MTVRTFSFTYSGGDRRLPVRGCELGVDSSPLVTVPGESDLMPTPTTLTFTPTRTAQTCLR